MKKVISILLVLCVAASLFAAVTVKAGFDFGTVSTKTLEDKNNAAELDKDAKLYTHGFGLDIAVIGDVAPNLAVYGDISATWPIFAEIDGTKFVKDSNATFSFTDIQDLDTEKEVKVPGLKVSTFALRAGALYKVNVEGFDLGFGGGLMMSFFNVKFGDKDLKDDYMIIRVRNYGLSLYATGTYAVAKNVGINLTINPDVYLYNYTAASAKGIPFVSETEEKGIFEAYGFRAGFAFNASVGVTFTF